MACETGEGEKVKTKCKKYCFVLSWFLQGVDMKRYKYLKYDNGRHLGDKGGCAQPIESRSWTGRLFLII